MENHLNLDRLQSKEACWASYMKLPKPLLEVALYTESLETNFGINLGHTYSQ